MPVPPAPDSGDETTYWVGAFLPASRHTSLDGGDLAGAIFALTEVAATGEQIGGDEFLLDLSSGTCNCGMGGSLLIFGPELISLWLLILKGATASRPGGIVVPVFVSASASSSPSMTPSSSRMRCTLGIPLTSSTGGPTHLWPFSDREYSSISPAVSAAWC